MKKILLSVFFVAIWFSIYAQPSDATVIKDIRKRFSTGKIKLEGSSTSKEQIGIVWHYYYWRHFTLSKKDASGLTGEISSSVIYEKKGNSYTFHNYGVIETNVAGMKDPDKTELVKYFKNNLSEFLGGAYNDVVGEMPIITIPANTKFKWASPEQVTFITKAIYSRKISNTQVEKAEHYYETMLFRKGQSGKWNRILADEIEGNKKIISKTAYNSSMKTLQEIDDEQAASAAISSLPYVLDPPVFKSDKQLFYYIHDRLMASAPQEAKAHLYKVLSKSSFESGSILKGYVQIWVDKLINNLNPYQYTYCKYPKEKEEQAGAISFYDKEMSKSVRYRGVEENGTWKLKEITYYVPSQDLINRVAKKVGNCADKPDLTVKEKVTYNIGDIVDVHYSNGDFAAKIKKRDTNFDNRYFITFLDNGKSQWMKDDQFSPSTKKSELKETGTSTVTTENQQVSADFKVGDHVGVKLRSGVMNGKITKITGSNYLIKWDEAGYKDMWAKKEHLTKL